MRVATLAIAALSLLLAPAASAVTIFTATLSGAQQNPPVATSASGSATLTLNDAQDRLEISIQLNGLDLDGNQTPGTNLDDVVLAHIHRAAVGVNGSVVFGFIGPNSDTNGDLMIDAAAGTIFSAWDLTEGAGTTLAAELQNLANQLLYINIHTVANGGGEIRGQIVPEPGTSLLFGLGLLGLAARRLGRRRATG